MISLPCITKEKSEFEVSITSLLPLLQNEVHSDATIKHALQTIGEAVTGVRAPSDLGVGGRWPSCLKKITQCLNAWVLKSGYRDTQIARKTKAFTILTSNEIVLIPKIVILKPHILYDDLYLQSTRYSKIKKLLRSCPKMLIILSILFTMT